MAAHSRTADRSLTAPSRMVKKDAQSAFLA